MTSTSLPGPHNIVTSTLSNGLRVLVYENFASETIVIDGTLRSGAINESAEQAGLADFTGDLLRRGAATRTFDAINELTDEVGASFGFDMGRHGLAIEARCLVPDFDLVLDLLTESLASPTFDAEQIEQVRSRTLTSIREREHDPRSMAALSFRELLYGATHPYGHPITGYEHTISALTRDDVATFHRRFIGPKDGVIALAGAIRADDAIARLERTLGAWQQPEAQPNAGVPPTPILHETVARSHIIPGKSQSDILLGWPGIPRRHPDYFPVLLCNSVLGRFGMGGRIGNNVREKQGMAYYAYSTFAAMEGAGSWYAAAGVNPGNVDAAITAIRNEIERIIAEPVTDEELADVQANLSGSLPLSLETNSGLAGALENMAWYDLGLDYLQTYADRVRAVTQADVQRAAQAYLDPNIYVLAIAGP